jgi:hypothetical protein
MVVLLLVLEQEDQAVNGLAQLFERRCIQRPQFLHHDAAHAEGFNQLGEEAWIGLYGGPAACWVGHRC